MGANKPILTLDMDDKIYLAVAKNFTDALSFVYTLACNKIKKTNQYEMVATPQIHTFRDKASARVYHDTIRVYHDTIEQMVEAHESNPAYKMLFDVNQGQIEKFMSHQK